MTFFFFFKRVVDIVGLSRSNRIMCRSTQSRQRRLRPMLACGMLLVARIYFDEQFSDYIPMNLEAITSVNIKRKLSLHDLNCVPAFAICHLTYHMTKDRQIQEKKETSVVRSRNEFCSELSVVSQLEICFLRMVPF